LEQNFNQSIIIENRKQISINGVKDCLGFDEETIALITSLGKLVIKGEGLHIQNFDTKSGELTAEGKVNAAIFTVEQNNKTIFGKIFR